jgi:hypothetical protein
MSETLVLPVGPEASAGDPQRDIRQGTIIAVLFFVLFLGWAAFMPLDAGVYAQGQIAVRAFSIATAARSTRLTFAKASG